MDGMPWHGTTFATLELAPLLLLTSRLIHSSALTVFAYSTLSANKQACTETKKR
ncbi:hypothetical protein LZ31DRAFT_557276 [Colletotrichum somersetense]|nr:hypothetical protein LZ31DRAFT_557276 [Colletotrichum somersetense]